MRQEYSQQEAKAIILRSLGLSFGEVAHALRIERGSVQVYIQRSQAKGPGARMPDVLRWSINEARMMERWKAAKRRGDMMAQTHSPRTQAPEEGAPDVLRQYPLTGGYVPASEPAAYNAVFAGRVTASTNCC
jgi:hypothetical protein